MNVLIVHWHPEPASFCSALMQTAVSALGEAGHDVMLSDLFAMDFDPVYSRENFISVADADYFKPQQEEAEAWRQRMFNPQLQGEIDKLLAADLLVLNFPLWWFGLPAAMKGWVDRTFAYGAVYGFGHIYESGMLEGKRSLLSFTTGGPEEMYRKGGKNGDIHAILRPIQRGMLAFTGCSVLAPNICYQPAHISGQQRQSLLDAYRKRLASIFSESPIDPGVF